MIIQTVWQHISFHDSLCEYYGDITLNATARIVETILDNYPDTQAVYLFGTFGTPDERPDSDADFGILLPHKSAQEAGSLAMSDLRFDLERLLGKDVDLINLRLASTVLRKEVIAADRRPFTADEYAAGEFEMLTLSFYQKLNEERVEIIADMMKDGRFYKID